MSGLELSDADVAVEDMVADLASFEVDANKDGPAVIPAEFSPCPAQCRNHGQPKKVDCGGGKFHRLGANVAAMSGFGVDLDHVTQDALEEILAALKARGLTFFWWNTFSHAPPDDARARILIPFARPFPLKSPAQWSKGAWPMLVAHLGLDGKAAADDACKDPARIYYLPRKPAPEAVRHAGHNLGVLLDWAPIFGTALEGFTKAAEVAALPPQERPELPVNLQEVQEKLRRVRRADLAPLVRNLIAGKALVNPPHLRQPGEPARYIAWRQVTAALSMVADEWMATDALVEVLRPSWHAEVQEDPEGHTKWDTVVELLQKARDSAPKKKAEKEAQRTAQARVWDQIFAAKYGGPDGEGEGGGSEGAGGAGPGDDGAPPPPAGHGLSGAALRERLQLVEVKGSDKPALRKSLHNLSVILRESFIWARAFRRNLLTRQTELWGGPMYEGQVVECRDTHVSRLRHWFVEEFGVEYPMEAINEYVELAADDNAYDPIQEYLRALEWDGVPRIDTMLEKYLRASVTTDDATDRTLYVRAVSRKWMISAAARALRPGAQVDTMLVLQGAGGIGKSTAARVLGGRFFVDFDYDLESDEARAACSENWVAEMGELSSMSRTQREHVKMFLTKTFDKYRAKYARRQESRPRRVVFIGTTNEDEIFHDDEGNRRFWPVTCTGLVDADGLARDRDQLWAEAVARLEAGEEWHLSREEAIAAKAEVHVRTQHDTLAEQVSDWYAEKEPALRPEALRISDALRDIMYEPRGDRAAQMRLAKSLRHLGFTKRREMREGLEAVWWHAPAAMLNAPRRQKAGTSFVQQVVAAKPARA